MESTVIYRDRQELQSADLNNTQDFARASLDHVVYDAVEGGKAYSGFSATKTAATEVTLSSGRLYAGGAVYARDEDVVVDMFNVLPLVTRKRVAIVTFGQAVETDVQPRDFLIDAQTGTTEPQSVAMENLRRAEVSTVAGIEGPDPSYPATDANVTVIAYVLLDTTGIVTIEQWAATQLPNLRNVANRTVALENWRGQISGQVDTLRTDLSTLADRLAGFATKAEIVELTEQLDEVRTEVYAPGAYIYYGTNHFLTADGSDTAHADFDALVEEGIRFPRSGEDVSALALLNLVEDMKMRLYFARFERTRASIELTALQLAGGILDLDVIHQGVTPPACRLDIEVQVSGAWIALDGDEDGPDLSGLPGILPIRMTLTGTTDLMPGFGITGSQSVVSRPKTAFTWISEGRALGSATTSVKIISDLQHYVEDDHDCTVSLLTGAAYDTTETADVVEDRLLADGTIRRTSIFNVTAVSDYRVKIVGATVSAAVPFLVSELIEYAQF